MGAGEVASFKYLRAFTIRKALACMVVVDVGSLSD